MKKILFSLLFLTYLTVFAQETPLKIDYSPKSPDVSSLFDFTDISVGYYTGSVSKNIPIASLSEGPLSTNINLSYSTSGHKVAERATWVGLGWNLNAGGVIAREVRGKPDDSDAVEGFLKFLNTRGYDSIDDVIGLNEQAKAVLYNELSSYGCVDAEPDVFRFNVGDLNGKIMFDWDGNLRVACNRKIQVEYTQVTDKYEILEWKIIDDLGNKYIFSNRETNEITGLVGFNIVCNNDPYTSAWKLTSIEDSSSKHRIDYEYESYTMDYPVEYSKQHTIYEAGGSGPISASSSGLSIVGSYLKTIKGNNSNNKIEFVKGTIPRTDVSGTNLYPLGGVKLKNKSGDVINEFQFNYTNGSRLRLDDIKQVKNFSSIDLYKFEYNTITLPDYNSYSIDHWGYYNDKSNNVPYPTYTFRAPSGSIVSYAGADREPSSIHSEAMVLNKIEYPTKGYSTFKYEGHDYSFIQSISISGQEAIPIPTATSAYVAGNPNNLDELVQSTIYFNVDVNTTIDNSNTLCSGGTCIRKVNIALSALNLADFAQFYNSPKLKIYDSNDQIVYQKTNVPFNTSYTENVSIWLPEGEYKIVAETRNYGHGTISGSNNFIHAYLTWDNDSENSVEKKNVGGIRVQEIAEFDHDGTLIKKKNFDYSFNNSSNISSGSIDALPKYEDKSIYWQSVEPGHSIIKQDVIRYSGSLLQLGTGFGHVRYKEVTVNEVGINDTIRKVYEFTQVGNDNITFNKPYPPSESKQHKKGLLVKESSFSFENNSFIPVQKVISQYGFNEIEVRALKVSFFIGNDPSSTNSTDVYAASYYRNYLGHNQQVSRKVETEFEQSIVAQEDSFTYDAGLNRVTVKSSNTSKNDTLNVDYTYPDTDTSSAINTTMISNNIIGIPIKTKVSRNGSIVSNQETKYKNWIGNIIRPEFLKIAKGIDSLEERTIIHNYDDRGNPIEVSRANGTKTVYIWGYEKQYPIAKIENAAYAQVSSYVANLELLSDQDIDTPSEDILKSNLNNLRTQFPNAMVSTYTYDPLIGVTSMTDPRGYTLYYEYDEFNRLKRVKDANGNIISQNEYHYKNQE